MVSDSYLLIQVIRNAVCVNESVLLMLIINRDRM